MNQFGWISARTELEAASAASSTVADAMRAALLPRDPEHATTANVLKAGGIDLVDLLKEGLLAPDAVVDLRYVPGLADIREHERGLKIGAMATLAALAGNERVRRSYPILADAIQGAASPQIRNMATIGGNLLQRPRCWYLRSREHHCLRKGGGHCFALSGENRYHAIFDNRACAIVHPSTAATPLVALGASVRLEDAAGTGRELRLEDFFVSTDRDLQHENDLRAHEVLTAITLPQPSPTSRSAYLRQGEKDSFDWPLADVAVILDLSPDGVCTKAAIVLGAAAPVPHRAANAERALVGSRIDAARAQQAAQAAIDAATPLSQNGYKVPLFEALIRRAIVKAVHE